MEKLDNDFRIFDEYSAELADNQKVTGCTCQPTMTNAGTNAMQIDHDTYGCPIHCNHQGIATWADEWHCACGASGRG